MYCPKCGKENPDNAQTCQFCNTSIKDTLESKQPVTVKISRLSIIALVLAVLSILVFFPPLEFLTRLLGRVVLLLPLLAVILGIISIVQIEQSGGKITGRIFAVGAVLIPVFAGLSLVLIISYTPRRSVAFRMVCGTNLSRIGKAMLIYANDYDDKLPRAGGTNSIWQTKINNWQASDRLTAFNLRPDHTGGSASISSSLYLLLKYEYVVDRPPNYAAPKFFVCKQDSGTTEFKPSKYVVRNKDLIDLWDFGPNPSRHCSFSYHMPYGPYALTTSSEPGMAVAADRNPWMPSPFVKVKRNFNKFNPDGSREKSNIGNAVAHQEDGQNVLFLDSHVGFEKRSYCGINDDNIYTYWNGPDIRRGAIPILGSQPADRLDSLLVNDPAISR